MGQSQAWGIVIMATVAVVLVVRFILVCRKEARFIAEAIPSADRVPSGRVHDDLERFAHYRRLWTFNRLAVTSCGTVPDGAADEYVFLAGTGSVQIVCLLARGVVGEAAGEGAAGAAGDARVPSLVGEAPARFLPRVGAFCTWDWPDPGNPGSSIRWHVKLKYDAEAVRAGRDELESIMRAYHGAVVRARLPQPWFIEVAGRDLLVVFPAHKVHRDVDKLVELHAILHEMRRTPVGQP